MTDEQFDQITNKLTKVLERIDELESTIDAQGLTQAEIVEKLNNISTPGGDYGTIDDDAYS